MSQFVKAALTISNTGLRVNVRARPQVHTQAGLSARWLSCLRPIMLGRLNLGSIVSRMFKTGAIGLLLLSVSTLAFGQAAEKPISEMNTEELAAFIKEQELQLEAVKQARDEQKAKHAEVQEALLDRQEKLNEIVIELSELCSERKELNPDDTEPCLPDES